MKKSKKKTPVKTTSSKKLITKKVAKKTRKRTAPKKAAKKKNIGQVPSNIKLLRSGCKLICPVCGNLGSYSSEASCEAARKAHNAASGHDSYCDCVQKGKG